MPTYNFTLSSWSDNSGSGGSRTWGNPGSAQVLDGVYSGCTGSFGTSHYLLGTNPSTLGTSVGANEILTSVKITVNRFNPVGSVSDSQLCLVVGGTVQTSINKANTGVFWPLSLAPQTYTFSSSDLATLGITRTSITSTFGVALAVAFNGNDTGSVDQISGSFTTIYSPVTTFSEPNSTVYYIPGIGVRSL